MGKKQNKEKLEAYIAEEDRRELIQQYFDYTMQDYDSALWMEYIYEKLALYESKELYLPCAGIKKAIDFIEKNIKIN